MDADIITVAFAVATFTRSIAPPSSGLDCPFIFTKINPPVDRFFDPSVGLGLGLSYLT